MADTLTIKQDDQSTDVENLTTEEQDSLQVGEEMAKEQGELLAGKYKNAEDLEKAYVELQKKLGDKEEPEATKDEEEVTDTKDEPEEKGEAYSLIESASDEYYQNGESLSPETLEKFKGMSGQDLVEGYMQMVKDNPQTNQPEIDVTTAEINKMLDRNRRQMYRNVMDTIRHFKPKMYIPFAGYFSEEYWSDNEIKQMNIKNCPKKL